MSVLLFEQDLIKSASNTTHRIVIAMKAVIAMVGIVLIIIDFFGFKVIVVVAIVVIVEVVVHAVDDIDPEEPVNMPSFFAVEFTQATPQRI